MLQDPTELGQRDAESEAEHHREHGGRSGDREDLLGNRSA